MPFKRAISRQSAVLTPSLLASAIALAVSSHAWAQPESMDDMVITANRTATKIADIPGSVQVIEAEQVEQQMSGGVDFKDALSQLIPSLDGGSQGRTNYGQLMRGRSVLVMIDGVSLNSSRSVSRQFESIDPFNIERIEVISGASAIYGAGASGGIINIITKKGAQDESSFSVQAGLKSGFNSDDLDRQLAASAQGGTETVDYRVSASLRQSDGFYNADDDQVLPDITQTSSQYIDQQDLMASVGVQLDDEQRLELVAQYFKNEQDANKSASFGINYAGFSDPEQISVQHGLVLAEQPATTRQLLNLQYSHDDIVGQSLYLQGYYRSEEMQFYPFPRIAGANSTISASNQQTDVYGVKSAMVSALDEASTELVYGVDLSRESFSSSQQYYDFAAAAVSGGLIYNPTVNTGRYPEVDIDTAALFLQANTRLSDKLTVNSGMRYEYANANVGDFVATTQQYQVATGALPYADAVPGGEADYSATLFNLGAVFDLNAQHQFYANFSQGYDIPDPAKYYGYGSYDGSSLISGIDVAGNKADAIETDSYELGWRFDNNQLSTQVAAYYSLSDKRITNSSRNLSVQVVDEKKRVYGLESAASYRINHQWLVGGNLHLVKTEKKTEGHWQDLEAYYASNNKLGAYVDWTQDKLGLRLQANMIDDHTDGAERQLDGYTVTDLLGHYVLPVGQLNFGINNLLNEDYQTLWSQKAQMLYANLTDPAVVTFEGRGRTYSVSYSLDF
ncbi:TonB-dependent receptor [Oceanospirillum beijerinckii]|uniref:TonB-dependent receptor n=1 Tax=Oceanospirillum beijerinckii TaxID=64976 RepID=UPI0003F841C0|nr:TonB-dependent receptor [Oceanospirillum beijerinckii]